MKGKGFQSPKIKMRSFLLECNCVDLRGNESAIAYELLSIPRMKNSQAELNYLKVVVWSLLESDDFKHQHINQIFALTADGNDSLFRMQVKESSDEELTKINPPEPEKHESFLKQVEKKVLRSQGNSDISYIRKRLPVRSLREFFEWREKYAN